MGDGRDVWSNPIEFVLTCLGYAVGLGNVWRFPYLAFRNGGGAFLIPYFLCLVAVGLPLFYLEISFGQFASLGPLKIWTVSPLMKGLGYTMVIVAWFITIYYVVVIAWCLYFFFASMTNYLPWQDCQNEWNTCLCQDGKTNFSLPDPWEGKYEKCLNFSYPVNTSGISVSQEYFINRVLKKTDSWTDPGKIKWDVTLCNLLAWIIIFLVLSKGIKSLGKVVYFTATFPYILLTVLLVRGVTLDGYYDGILYYMSPKLDRLTDANVWSDAAVQIFFSLSTCSGGLIAMASFNRFNNNVLRDALLVPIINCLTSFYAGFVIFSVLGFMAHRKGVPIDDVAMGGPGLAFIVYPEALAQMPISPLWAILFFFMMATLGFSTSFSSTETVITGLMDELPMLSASKWRRIGFRASVCLTGFLLGLPMTSEGGEYMLNIMDTALGGFPLLFVGLFELIVIIFVYGFFRFKNDIEMMIGKGLFVRISFFFIGPCWLLISPLSLMAVIMFKIIKTEPVKDGTYLYPVGGQVVYWLIVVTTLIPIPIYLIYYSCRNGLAKPRKEWGPAQNKNRTGRYSVTENPTENGITSYDNVYDKGKELGNGEIIDYTNNAYDNDDTSATKF